MIRLMKWFCLMLTLISQVSAEEAWQNYLHKGLCYLQEQQYQEALIEFNQALDCIGDQTQHPMYPFALLNRAHCNYFLKNYLQVLEDTEKALAFETLTDYERLTGGMKRIATLMNLNNEEAAIEEYKNMLQKVH